MRMARKVLVLDANILIRAVLGRKVRELIMGYAERVDFFAPAVCFDDARKYLPELLEKRRVPAEPALAVLDTLARVVQAVETEWLEGFETQARLRLERRDEDDWPVLAAALALDCPIWTEDADFFGVGVATWTTINVQHYLDR
jgi:predicted nucleic acid-binding protein